MKSTQEIDSMAVNLRRNFGEDSLSPIDIFSIARSIDNLTLVCYPLGKNISGICIKGEKSNLIAINSSMTLGRQRFSLAHEFYHLYYDNQSNKSISSKNFLEGDEKEKEADIFASHLLMPSASLYHHLSDVNEITLELIVKLEQLYGMSRQAILFRLKEEKKIGISLYEEMQTKVQSTALKLGYETSLYQPTLNKSVTGEYIRMAEKLYANDIISTGKYEELLLDAFRDDLVYGDFLDDNTIYD